MKRNPAPFWLLVFALWGAAVVDQACEVYRMWASEHAREVHDERGGCK